MSGGVAATLVGAGCCLIAAPYLARLTRSVPDREVRTWWRGLPVSGRRTFATTVLAATFGALAGAAGGWDAALPAFVAVSLVGTPLVVIDYEHHRLPDRLVYLGAALETVLLTAAVAERGSWHQLLRALEGAAVVFAVLLLLAVVAPRSFGFGDVKLGGILGGYLGWAGWVPVYYGIFAGFLLGALLSLALLATRRATLKTAIPFGPMLLLGALLVLAFDLVPDVG
ncbi:MAG TPA: prepilin peptidase [Jatrophihabitans sp.]|nr:prepilin peptidase [Jatrophihabitans sp.]